MNSNISESALKNLEPEQLITFLEEFKTHDRYVLAISGGKDSIALAHLFFSIKEKINHSIEMVYVDHGLQEVSNEWGDFCREQASKFGFEFQQLTVNCRPVAGESIEAWARDARYNLLSTLADENTLVFTGHHQDDQAETLLLRLFRGTGVRGMACMQVARKLGKGLLIRPLLNISSKQIDQYVSINNLSWVHDKSNDDKSFDRNYLRQEIKPLIEKRWPEFQKSISRIIAYQQEAGELLDVLAVNDLQTVCDDDKTSINIDKLKVYSKARIKNLLMCWIKGQHFLAPNHQHIEEIINHSIFASDDRLPLVNWADIEVRKYKNRLYLLKTKKLESIKDEIKISFHDSIIINEEQVKWQIVEGKGIAKHFQDKSHFSLQFRRGGEKIKLANRGISKTIKQLFQENSVLPWKRESFPLIYIDNKLAAIPGICTDDYFAAKENEPGIVFHWTGISESIAKYD